jgi:hypothetical protein
MSDIVEPRREFIQTNSLDANQARAAVSGRKQLVAE